jgi:cytidylate kinase
MISNGVDVSDPAAIATASGKPVIESGTDPSAPTITVDGLDASGPIREQDVTAKVSAVSAVPEVRSRITELQRSIAKAAEKGIVVEGRDIGTTVLPDADLKIFLTASPEARAARRSGELKGSDVAATREALIKRDAADSSRKTSPLAKADDAVEVDTTDLTLQQVIECVVTLVEERRNRDAAQVEGSDRGTREGHSAEAESRRSATDNEEKRGAADSTRKQAAR